MAHVATGIVFGVATGVVNDASEFPESSPNRGFGKREDPI